MLLCMPLNSFHFVQNVPLTTISLLWLALLSPKVSHCNYPQIALFALCVEEQFNNGCSYDRFLVKISRGQFSQTDVAPSY